MPSPPAMSSRDRIRQPEYTDLDLRSPSGYHGEHFESSPKHVYRKQGPGIYASLEDWWFFEFMALLGSGAALVGIATVLIHFDNRQQPDWTLISLNTLISWLSTVSKGLALVPISSSIGQLKWVWYAKSRRPLSQLYTFDVASRGAFGSGQLILMQRAL